MRRILCILGIMLAITAIVIVISSSLTKNWSSKSVDSTNRKFVNLPRKTVKELPKDNSDANKVINAPLKEGADKVDLSDEDIRYAYELYKRVISDEGHKDISFENYSDFISYECLWNNHEGCTLTDRDRVSIFMAYLKLYYNSIFGSGAPNYICTDTDGKVFSWDRADPRYAIRGLANLCRDHERDYPSAIQYLKKLSEDEGESSQKDAIHSLMQIGSISLLDIVSNLPTADNFTQKAILDYEWLVNDYNELRVANTRIDDFIKSAQDNNLISEAESSLDTINKRLSILELPTQYEQVKTLLNTLVQSQDAGLKRWALYTLVNNYGEIATNEVEKLKRENGPLLKEGIRSIKSATVITDKEMEWLKLYIYNDMTDKEREENRRRMYGY